MDKEPSIFVVVDSSLTLIDWTKTRAMAEHIANARKDDEYSVVEFCWNGWGFAVAKTLELKKE